MTTIQIADHIFAVDVNKTKEYYQTHTLCDCDYCRNYYKQIKGKFPQLEAFLSQFGVDISKPDEISTSYEMDDCIHYIMIDYTVSGKVENIGQSEINISDSLPFTLRITDGFSSPNEQTSDYFTISIDTEFTLPRALSEPIQQQQNRTKNFFRKLFKA